MGLEHHVYSVLSMYSQLCSLAIVCITPLEPHVIELQLYLVVISQISNTNWLNTENSIVCSWSQWLFCSFKVKFTSFIL